MPHANGPSTATAPIKLIRAAKTNDIDRYVMISAMGVGKPRGNDIFRAYLQAKAEADEALRNSGLEYTIIKPGRLTNDPGTGRVALAPECPKGRYRGRMWPLFWP